MDTSQKLQQANQTQSGNNEVPTVDDGQDDGQDGGQDGGGLPLPSMSKKQVAVIGAVVAAVIVWKLYRAQSSSGSSEIAEVAKNGVDSEATVEDEDGDDEIRVPVDNSDPLAGDEAVAEAFRKRGVLDEPEG